MKPVTLAALMMAAAMGGLPSADALTQPPHCYVSILGGCEGGVFYRFSCEDVCPSTKPCEGGCPEVGRPDVDDLAPKRPCPRSEDDPGFGGTHVTCYYECGRFDALAITAVAEDPDADVSGYTDCGGAHATCERTPQVCGGVSRSLAEFDDSDQGCVADSHEFYSSKVTVTCVAAGRGLVCRLTGVACPTLTATAAAGLCVQQNPSAAVEDIERLVAMVTADAITSFVSFEFQGKGESFEGFAVGLDATGDEPVCWAGPI